MLTNPVKDTGTDKTIKNLIHPLSHTVFVLWLDREGNSIDSSKRESSDAVSWVFSIRSSISTDKGTRHAY